MRFVEYLERVGLSRSNWRDMERMAEAWLAWLKARKLTVGKAGYSALMDYVGHLREAGKNSYRINRVLQTISHYYRYKQLDDVAYGVRVRGVEHAAPQKLLTPEELASVYESYQTVRDSVYYHYTDKLVLGLIVFQGLELGELERLELRDLDLAGGKLTAPAGRVRQSRVLLLDARQVLLWRDYVDDVRPLMATVYQDEGLSKRLLSPQADVRDRIHHQLKRLSVRVKRQSSDKLGLTITKLGQLRQSRIAEWVERYGLARAQYLSGLRSMQSVERYRRSGWDDLERQVGKFHPLR